MNNIINRQKAFIETCRSISRKHAEKGVRLTNDNLIRSAMNHEAPSFFVSLRQAETNLNNYLAYGYFTTSTLPSRQRLWLELLRILKAREGIRNGTVHRPQLAYILSHCKAPSFYMSENYARKLFYSQYFN